MVTGKSDMQSVVDARGAKVSAYIRKPFSLNQLEAKMRIIHQRNQTKH
jgi:DNA-binding response OmpR family regulator